MKVYIKAMNGDVYPLDFEEKFKESYRYIISNLIKNYPHLSGKYIKLFKENQQENDTNIMNIEDGDILYIFVLSMRKCIIKNINDSYTLNIYDENKDLIDSIKVQDIVERKGKYNKNIEEYINLVHTNLSNLDNTYYIYYE